MTICPSDTVRQLLSFIRHSPTAFHAVESVAQMLDEAGFIRLTEGKKYALHPKDACYITRNGSSLIAFRIPEDTPTGFMIAASHSDSPSFKLKETGEIQVLGKYTKLNTERYGGMILSSWLDRPLSLAGRIILDTPEGLRPVLVNIDRDLLVIPNVAIHLNRSVNDGFSWNPAVDTLPLLAQAAEPVSVHSLLAEQLDIAPETIVGQDLFLYARDPGGRIGAHGEFFVSPRIDDLECAFTTLQGFLTATPSKAIAVYALFDNEETGSESKQGAASDFLSATLRRIAAELPSAVDLDTLLSHSFMLSADNAHACHPNHPELSDGQNAPHMNGGVVIKFNASQRYTTDAVSAALVKKICQNVNVPVQFYANRSDMPGGSTLGSISNTKVSILTADIGLAQLAMHSACETAGSQDPDHMITATREFFSSALHCENNCFCILH